MTNKLTLLQQRFVDEYIICGQATEAARRAGYKDKQPYTRGAKLLEVPKVKKAIEVELEKLAGPKIAEKEEVLEYLTSVLRGESTSEITVVEGMAPGVSEARNMDKAPDEKERLKAAELLGKRYGLYTENINIDNGDLEIKVIRDYGDNTKE